MQSRRHLVSVLAAVSMLILVVTGAAVTSTHDQARQAGLLSVHTIVAIAAVLVLIGLPIAFPRVGWIFLLAVLIETWLGYALKPSPGPIMGMSHAILGAILFATVVGIARVTSRSWQLEPELVQDYGWPSLKFLSSAATLLVALQVGFGAGIRHSMVGVIPHLLGALVVALFLLIVTVFVSNQFPKHPVLRPLATALMVITGIQVFLGMTAFLMRMMNVAGTNAWLVTSVGHVATGSLVFATSVMLAMEIRRHVRPRAQAQ